MNNKTDVNDLLESMVIPFRDHHKRTSLSTFSGLAIRTFSKCKTDSKA